ncbi:MAG: cytochrome c biogenesis protein CcdA [Gaiellaceae bacterium]
MRRRYGLLVLATVPVALVGYLGYLVYPRFDLPASAGGGLLVLAAAAGVASFFSPCSFPLLVSILARSPASARESRGGAEPSLAFAGALALGAAAFLVLAGAVIALAGAALFEGVTFTSASGRVIRAVVGSLLILLGLMQLDRLRISFRRLEPVVHGFLGRQAGVRRRRPLTGYFLFGFGYIFAGFG